MYLCVYMFTEEILLSFNQHTVQDMIYKVHVKSSLTLLESNVSQRINSVYSSIC